MKAAARDALARWRKAWLAWYGGPRTAPFLLERSDGWCVCDVLYPRRLQEFWRAVVGLVVLLVGWLPGSDFRIPVLRALGARIGRGVYIAPGVLFDPLFPELVEIGDDVFLGIGCHLLTHEYTTTHMRLGRVVIGTGSVIGAWSTIRSGVTIGRRAMVGFHSFVNRDVPDGTTVVGIPARPLRKE